MTFGIGTLRRPLAGTAAPQTIRRSWAVWVRWARPFRAERFTPRARPEGPQQREEDDLADGAAVGEKHRQPVDADAFAGRGRQAVGEGADVVFVHGVGFLLAALAPAELLEEALVLLERVVEFREGVAELKPAGEDFEALGERRVVVAGIRERRAHDQDIVDERRLDEPALDHRFEKMRGGEAGARGARPPRPAGPPRGVFR